MCGIIGILGNGDVTADIIQGLRRLEYRGYDSAGVATLFDGRLDRRRAIGKLNNLAAVLDQQPLPGKSGIGHTRWATHGSPRLENSHPLMTTRVAVVHNGIIENFAELRSELQGKGVNFQSETDTEVVAHLVDQLLQEGYSPSQAADLTLRRLQGAFALVFLFEGEDNLMIAARRGSPLVVGYGDGEMFVGSDAVALGPLTNRFTYLEEGDWAVITRTSIEIFNADGQTVDRNIVVVDVTSETFDKGGHQHYMAKEMAEQPEVMRRLLSEYLVEGSQWLALLESVDFSSVKRIVMVACGTAHYSCQVAKYWFEQLSRVSVEVDIASEFRYRDPVLNPDDVVIFVSQSGETADTLAALRHVKPHVASTIAVVNVETSSIARDADIVLPILAGPEIGVASTKAFTAQLLVLLMTSLRVGVKRGAISPAQYDVLIEELRTVPHYIGLALSHEPEFKAVAQSLAGKDDVLFLGRGCMFPMAREAALKLKEISYIHAQAYAAGELKHGPIALVDENLPIVFFAPFNDVYDKSISNLQEVLARGGRVILLSDGQGVAKAGPVERSIALPTVPDLIGPLVYAVPAQMIAYHVALARGTDVDQPRNLAKSVTVE